MTSASPTSTPDGVVVAVDVGGTGIKAALVRPPGEIARLERHPTGADRGPDAVVETILGVAEGLAAQARAGDRTPLAVGITVPGVVDEAGGVAAWSTNVGFRDVPLRKLAEDRLALPVALGHDVRAGGAAEARLGAARGARHVLFVAVGTGIAAAHVVDGRAAAGAHGVAGELGHVVVRPGGTPCFCGNRGCLEAVASAAAIARAYAVVTGVNRTAADVVARAAEGEETAARVWRDAVAALADGLFLAQALHDVEEIVVGGGLAEAGDALFAPLRAALHERITFQRMPRLVPAVLGDRAGCLGAALLALDLLR